MKKHIKRLAAYFVTAYAKKLYGQAAQRADELHDEDGDMYYVVQSPTDLKKLIVINTRQFLDIRHLLNIPSKKLRIVDMKNQCWYHTANKEGKDSLSCEEIDVRRLAFVRELLGKAKLL